MSRIQLNTKTITIPKLSYVLYNSTAPQTHNLHKKYIIEVTSAGDRWVSLQTQQPAIKKPIYQVTTEHPVTVCSCINSLNSKTSVHIKM